MRFDLLLGGEGWLPAFSVRNLCKFVCGKTPTTLREMFYCLCLTGNGTALLALVGLVLLILYRIYFPAVNEVEERELETERMWQEHERKFGYHAGELRGSHVVGDCGNLKGSKMREVAPPSMSSAPCQQYRGSASHSDDHNREHED